MRLDNFTKTSLLLIILLLLVDTFHSYFTANTAQAAPAVQYKIARMDFDDMRREEADLNAIGKDGWTFVGSVSAPAGTPGVLIFRK